MPKIEKFQTRHFWRFSNTVVVRDFFFPSIFFGIINLNIFRELFSDFWNQEFQNLKNPNFTFKRLQINSKAFSVKSRFSCTHFKIVKAIFAIVKQFQICFLFFPTKYLVYLVSEFAAFIAQVTLVLGLFEGAPFYVANFRI